MLCTRSPNTLALALSRCRRGGMRVYAVALDGMGWRHGWVGMGWRHGWMAWVGGMGWMAWVGWHGWMDGLAAWLVGMS